MQRLREELQKVTLVVRIHKNAEISHALMIFLHDRVTVLREHRIDALPNSFVVRIRNREEVNASATKFRDRCKFIVCAQRKVLHARGVVVPVEILLNLALLLTSSRLIDRHLDEVIAARHDLRHQRGILSADVFVIEVLEHREAEDFFVPLHPVVHLAQFNITHCVIDKLQSTWMLAIELIEREAFDMPEARHEESALLQCRQCVGTSARDEGVNRAAVGLNARHRDRACRIGVHARFIRTRAAILDRLLPRLFRVKHRHREVFHAVAVQVRFAASLSVSGERRFDEQSDVALREQIRCALAATSREVRNLCDFETKCARVVVRSLLCVPDIEAHVIDIDQLQRVGGSVERRGRAERGHARILVCQHALQRGRRRIIFGAICKELPSAEGSKFNEHSRTYHFAAELANEFDARTHRAACGEEIVSDKHATARFYRVFVNLEAVRSVLKRVFDRARAIGKLAAFARGHESRRETGRDRRAENESTTLGTNDDINARRTKRIRHDFHSKREPCRIRQQRRDIFEEDAGLGKVRDIADERSELIAHR